MSLALLGLSLLRVLVTMSMVVRFMRNVGCLCGTWRRLCCWGSGWTGALGGFFGFFFDFFFDFVFGLDMVLLVLSPIVMKKSFRALAMALGSVWVLPSY